MCNKPQEIYNYSSRKKRNKKISQYFSSYNNNQLLLNNNKIQEVILEVDRQELLFNKIEQLNKAIGSALSAKMSTFRIASFVILAINKLIKIKMIS